jgi:pilus assembly protein CpaF
MLPQEEKSYTDLKARVQNKILEKLDPEFREWSRRNVMQAQIESLYEAVLKEEAIVLSRSERKRLFDQIVADLSGLGPLEPLLQDEHVTEILVDGHDRVYVERRGKLEDAPVAFRDNAHVLDIIHRIAAPLGRRVDESHPILDLRLSDGSRVNVVIPPIALSGPTLTIRKFPNRALLTVEELIGFGAWNQAVAEFLRACVQGRANLLISGGTGSGKTTLLNILAVMIPADERIITVETASELRLPQRRVVRLEGRPPNFEGRGEITARDLMANAVKMRPDRLILSEARGAEVLDFIQAMNMGHDGSMCTIHASSPRDALARLEVMASSGNPSIPLLGLREQISTALNLIVHIERLRDGSRKVMAVTEVDGMRGDALALTDVFLFQQTGYADGKVQGRFTATGQTPKFLKQIRDAGIDLPMDFFRPE